MKNDYVSYFLEYESFNDKFRDCFSEFIYCLTEVDLSESTIEYLYGIFIKDTRMYFEK